MSWGRLNSSLKTAEDFTLLTNPGRDSYTMRRLTYNIVHFKLNLFGYYEAFDFICKTIELVGFNIISMVAIGLGSKLIIQS